MGVNICYISFAQANQKHKYALLISSIPGRQESNITINLKASSREKRVTLLGRVTICSRVEDTLASHDFFLTLPSRVER